MSEQLKESTQLARYISHKNVTMGAKNTPAVELTYMRLDGEAPKEMSLKYLKGVIGESSQEVAKQFKEGYEFVLVKVESPNPKDPSRPFWNLKEFKDKGTWVEKPKKPWNGGGGGWKAGAKTYDDTGVKVGAARNQAIAFLSATKGKDFTLDDVDKVAYEIVGRQAAQEDTVRSGKAAEQTAPDVSKYEAYSQDLDNDIPF